MTNQPVVDNHDLIQREKPPKIAPPDPVFPYLVGYVNKIKNTPSRSKVSGVGNPGYPPAFSVRGLADHNNPAT